MITWAEFAYNPPAYVERATAQRTRGARGAGNRYERQVQAHLALTLGEGYVPSRWFVFRSRGSDNVRFVQPDGLFFDFERGVITCFEIKLKHTERAWWQLRQLYVPVLQHIFGTAQWRYAAVEIVCWYDPHVSFPERTSALRHITADSFEPGAIQVNVWNPARLRVEQPVAFSELQHAAFASA